MKGGLLEITDVATLMQAIMGSAYDSSSRQLAVRITESHRGSFVLTKQAMPL